MSETSFDYTEVVAAPLDAVWTAMKRTSELDVLGGQAVIERTSDADWTCQLEGDKHTTPIAPPHTTRPRAPSP